MNYVFDVIGGRTQSAGRDDATVDNENLPRPVPAPPSGFVTYPSTRTGAPSGDMTGIIMSAVFSEYGMDIDSKSPFPGVWRSSRD